MAAAVSDANISHNVTGEPELASTSTQPEEPYQSGTSMMSALGGGLACDSLHMPSIMPCPNLVNEYTVKHGNTLVIHQKNHVSKRPSCSTTKSTWRASYAAHTCMQIQKASPSLKVPISFMHVGVEAYLDDSVMPALEAALTALMLQVEQESIKVGAICMQARGHLPSCLFASETMFFEGKW